MEDLKNRVAPHDRQTGDPLAGPFRFKPAVGTVPTRVQTVGVEPDSYLRKGLLWTVFGIPNVCASDSITDGGGPDAAEALVMDGTPPEKLCWTDLVRSLEGQRAVIDTGTAAELARRSGYEMHLQTETGSATPSILVSHRQMNAPLYPEASRIRIAGDPPDAMGFATGDVFHSYARPEAGNPTLRGLRHDEALTQFADREGLTVWGVSEEEGLATLLSGKIDRGGYITIMDLRSVDRSAEPSGAETPTAHVFLSALGLSPVIFGKFLTAYREYDTFVEAVRTMASQSGAHASMDRIGTSSQGHDIWMLKIGARSQEPAVLVTDAIHSLEWGPVYGVLRYVRFLLDEAARETEYARDLLGRRQLWWVLCSNPDGWTTRDQEALGINLNRNFPGVWERCTPEGTTWDTYTGRRSVVHPGALKARGPAPGSEAETQTLMRLVDENRDRLATLVDFHETTAPHSFLHQEEKPDGTIPDMPYHLELAQGVARAFNGRLYAHANVVSFGPALSDFDTYRFQPFVSLERLVPGAVAGWLEYATERGLKGSVVEAAGADCTHYQTIRRTEYSALAAEQVLAAEDGALLRNPFGEERRLTLTLHRRPERVTCRTFDADDTAVEETREESPTRIERVIPPGGWVRCTYDS